MSIYIYVLTGWSLHVFVFILVLFFVVLLVY